MSLDTRVVARQFAFALQDTLRNPSSVVDLERLVRTTDQACVLRCLEASIRAGQGVGSASDSEVLALVNALASPALTLSFADIGYSFVAGRALTALEQRADWRHVLQRAQSGDRDALLAIGAEQASPAPAVSNPPAPTENASAEQPRNPIAPRAPSSFGSAQTVPKPARQKAALPRAPRGSARFENHRVFGSKAAVVFEIEEARSPLGGRASTLRIEGAVAASDGYDWSNKIAFQVTLVELPSVAAVLQGYMPELEFRGHGDGQDKALLLRRQKADGLFIRLTQSGRPTVAVPVTLGDLYYLNTLALKAMAGNDPSLGVAGVIACIQGSTRGP